VRIGKHLNFNVAGALHILFNQHGVAAKAVDGLALATGQGSCKVFALFNDAHAFATTTRAGFDERGVADAVGLALQQLGILVGAVVAGHQGHARRFHQALAFCLQPHGQDGARGWADEHQPGGRTGVGKVFVFAQETVTRVHGLCAGGFGSCQDGFPAEVAVFGRVTANVHGLVTGGHVFGVCIGI